MCDFGPFKTGRTRGKAGTRRRVTLVRAAVRTEASRGGATFARVVQPRAAPARRSVARGGAAVPYRLGRERRRLGAGRSDEIGGAHVCTPVTNAHLVCRLLLAKKTSTPVDKQ